MKSDVELVTKKQSVILVDATGKERKVDPEDKVIMVVHEAK